MKFIEAILVECCPDGVTETVVSFMLCNCKKSVRTRLVIEYENRQNKLSKMN